MMRFPTLLSSMPRSLAIVLASLTLVLSTADTSIPYGSVVGADEIELAFKKPEGKSRFEEGRAAFEGGEYKEAYDAFKDARKQAADRPTKTEVSRWMDGARGGNELVELRRRLESGRAAAVHAHASESLKKFRHTPIGDEYAKFVEDLEKDLFTVLENFDVKSSRYTEKYGKTFVEDEAMVQQGKRCLKWDVDKRNFELKVKNVPQNMTGYENGALIFWLHFERRGGPYQLIFYVGGKSTSAQGTAIDNAYIKQMTPHKGWKRIEVPLKKFQAQGQVTWEQVKDFRLQFVGGQKFTCHIDGIVLRK